MKAVSLLYHDAVKGNDFDASGFAGAGAAVYKLEVDELKRHFEAIAASGADKPSTIYDFLDAQKQDHVPLFLTFDDGGNSAALYIADFLDAFGWTGHFFITASRIGTPAFVDERQIRELKAKGHIIGSHSWSHPTRMAHCDWNEMVDEWRKSVSLLSDIVGEEVTVASVPGGYFSNKVAQAASNCGIRALFTSEPNKKAYYTDKCLVLGRYTLLRGMSPRVSVGFASSKTSSHQIRQYLDWNVKKAAKAIGGRHYVTIRELLLKK